MDLPTMVAGVGLLLFLAKLAEDVMLKLGVPGLVGPILVGFLLEATPLKEEYYFSPFLFLVGLSFTAFLLGAEELGTKVEEVTKLTILKGIAFYMISFVPALLLLLPFIGLRLAILLAATLAMSSTTRIYSLLRHSGLVHGTEEVLISSSVAELAGLFFVQLASTWNVFNLMFMVALLLFVIKFGEHVFRRLIEYEESFSAKELPLSIIMALIISVSYLAEVVGMNSAIMALILGILSAEYLSERPWIKKRLRIITHSFFEPLFFVGAGLAATFRLNPSVFSILLLTNAVVAIIKVVSGTKLFKWNKKASLATAIKGGVDSALLAAAWRKGVIDGATFSSALIVITLNTFVLALFFRGRSKKGYVKVCELELDRAAVDLSEPLKNVVDMLRTRPAVVVVDALNWPIGYVSAMDIIGLSEEEIERSSVFDVYHEGVPVLRCDDPVNKIVLLHEELEESPVIAVVKDYIGYVGSLYPTRILKVLEAI